jgi:hypothetical protein
VQRAVFIDLNTRPTREKLGVYIADTLALRLREPDIGSGY